MLVTWLKEQARKNIWIEYPFISCNEDLCAIFEQVLQQSTEWPKFEALANDQERKALIQDYVTTYGKIVCTEVNAKRNNTCTAIHKLWGTRKEAEEYLPEAQVILKIMKRKGLQRLKLQGPAPQQTLQKKYNKEVEKHRSLFDWVVGSGIGKVAGRNLWQEH